MSQLGKYIVGDRAPEDQWGKDLERELDKTFSALVKIINKGLTLADNFDAYIGDITTDAVPGNPTTITHGLKRTPAALWVIEQDKAGSIFKVSKSATTYVVASDASSMAATIIII